SALRLLRLGRTHRAAAVARVGEVADIRCRPTHGAGIARWMRAGTERVADVIGAYLEVAEARCSGRERESGTAEVTAVAGKPEIAAVARLAAVDDAVATRAAAASDCDRLAAGAGAKDAHTRFRREGGQPGPGERKSRHIGFLLTHAAAGDPGAGRRRQR